MKIIFSPSKGMKHRDTKNLVQSTNVSYKDKSEFLIKKILELDFENFSKVFKLKGALLEETYEKFKNRKDVKENKEAIFLYNGVSFKNLEVESYNKSSLEYAQRHLRILSALYGPMRPLDKINEYRLDMTIKFMKESLYSYWKKEIEDEFKIDEVIVNLASSEFSKMLDRKKYNNILDIDFRQNINGELKNISTEGKKARGLFLNYMIKNQIEDISLLKNFNLDNYSFIKLDSNEKKYLFVK
ncbi:MAG: YaaA family protein [Fusobacteriaceae bacterium]